jgi:hypothetical protein
MNIEQLVAILMVIAVAVAVASWAHAFAGAIKVDASTPDPSALRSPKPPRGYSDRLLAPDPRSGPCQRHVWLIAAREETAGHPRAIYRCQSCGAIEVREVV